MSESGDSVEPWEVAVVVSQGALHVVGLAAFIAGYLLHVAWLMVSGGIVVVLLDCVGIAVGALKPLFPVLCAIVLAIILKPWYTGVFWASAAFAALDLPHVLRTLTAPIRSAEESKRRQAEM